MQINILIDDEDVGRYAVLPIKWNALLDERLDEGRLSLRQCPTELFNIGALVIIRVDGKEQHFIVSADTSTEIPVGSGKYNHELSIIEPTKVLEGVMVETLTFSNNLGRTYDVQPFYAPPIWDDI